MKRYKRLGLLVLVLAGLSLATFALSRYEQHQEQVRASDAILLEITEESVTNLSWRYANGACFSFTCQEGTWQYDDDEAFPVSQEKIQEILAHFARFGVHFIISDVEDYGQYGLESPECTLTLTTSDAAYQLNLGNFSTLDQQRYVDVGDGNVYLVSEDPMDFVAEDLSQMIAHDEIPTLETIVSIAFSGSQELTLFYNDDGQYTYAQDTYFTYQGDAVVPLDTTAIRQYLSTVTALDLTDYVTYAATAEELAAFGLAEPLLTVSIAYSHENDSGETVTDTCLLHIGENTAQRAEADAAQGDNAPAVEHYIRLGDSPIVYTLDTVDYAILTAASYDDLRHKEVFWGDFAHVSQIDIVLEGQSHILSAQTEEDATVWHLDSSGEEVDLSQVETTLGAITADSFTQELPGETEELRLTLHLTGNIDTLEIALYRYDGSVCLAVVDGEPVSLVPRSSVMDLVEALQTIILN